MRYDDLFDSIDLDLWCYDFKKAEHKLLMVAKYMNSPRNLDYLQKEWSKDDQKSGWFYRNKGETGYLY